MCYSSILTSCSNTMGSRNSRFTSFHLYCESYILHLCTIIIFVILCYNYLQLSFCQHVLSLKRERAKQRLHSWFMRRDKMETRLPPTHSLPPRRETLPRKCLNKTHLEAISWLLAIRMMYKFCSPPIRRECCLTF